MSVIFNVSQLLKSAVGGTRSYDFDSDEPIDLDGSVASDVRGHVKFTLTNFGILAAVQVEAAIELTCARCLEPFTFNADAQFDAEYQPSIDIETGLPAKSSLSDTAFSITQNHQIDLTEALRQHLLLTVEMVPVCRPDCQGFCPTCGANLNEGPCDCPPAEEASPFAVLQGLLTESDSK
jgi:uncharacterized protein